MLFELFQALQYALDGGKAELLVQFENILRALATR